MKLRRWTVAAALSIISLLCVTDQGSAQDTNANKRAERRAATVEQRVERMTTELKLNDAQQAKVKALFEKETKQRQEMSAAKLSRDERREKMRDTLQEQRKELKAILTADQFEKWRQLREEMRARRSGGSGQNGVPAPAPAPEPKNSESKPQ